MTRRPGRSFVLLVGVAVGLELAGTGVAFFGLRTMARCYWAWVPGVARPRFPLACTKAITGAGFHLFVPVAILLALLCTTSILACVHGVLLVRSVCKADRILGPALSELPSELVAAAARARADRVELREDDEDYALCIGMLHPRVVVSTGLIHRLGPEELTAVLAHEELHRRRHAPLRQLAARVTARALFFVLLLDDLLEIHLVEEEILADRTSCAIAGRHALALALAKLSSSEPSIAGTSGFGRTTALVYRVKALADGSMCLPRLNPLRTCLSALSIGAVVLFVTWMPLPSFH